MAADFPELTRSAVINIVGRARDRGDIPLLAADVIRAKQSDGGKGSQPKAVAARVAKANMGGLYVAKGKQPHPDDRPRIDAVIALARPGDLSMTQIAERLCRVFPGTTKGTVSGIVTRARANGQLPKAEPRTIGVAKTGTAKSPRAARSARPAAAPRRAQDRAPPARTPAAPLEPFVLPPLPDIPYHAEGRERRRLAFEAMVDSRGCKFPIGGLDAPDFRYCCAPRDANLSYCPHHQAIAHIPGSSANARRSVSRPNVMQWAAE